MDEIDRLILANQLGIDANFTKQEIETLITSCKQENYNQYYNVVIEKVINQRITDDKEKVSVYRALMVLCTNLNEALAINKEDDNDIIVTANTIYKMFMTEDHLPKLDNLEF